MDPRRRTYRHLGFKRGPGSTLLSLATMKHALRAWRKGFRQGATQGDPWQQGGVLVAGGDSRHGRAPRGFGPVAFALVEDIHV